MKAILVVDVDEDIENYEATVWKATIWKKDPFSAGQYNYIGKYYLKPMPQKRILPKEMVEGTNYGEEPWFTDGYNACIDEILGE